MTCVMWVLKLSLFPRSGTPPRSEMPPQSVKREGGLAGKKRANSESDGNGVGAALPRRTKIKKIRFAPSFAAL